MDDTKIVTARPLTDNVTVKIMPWWQMLAVRVLRTYVQTLAGLTLAFLIVPVAPIMPGTSAYVLAPIVGAFLVAAQYALLPAVAALLQNLVELLTKLDQSYPQMRA